MKTYGNFFLSFVFLYEYVSWTDLFQAERYNKHADYSDYSNYAHSQYRFMIPPCVSLCLDCVEFNDYVRMNRKAEPKRETQRQWI